jgi:hypothetical protein
MAILTERRLGQSRFNWERESVKVLHLVSQCLDGGGGRST